MPLGTSNWLRRASTRQANLSQLQEWLHPPGGIATILHHSAHVDNLSRTLANRISDMARLLLKAEVGHVGNSDC
jgi:hypothetical protein